MPQSWKSWRSGVFGGWKVLLLSLRKGTYAEFCLAKHLNSKLGGEILKFMEKSHKSTSQSEQGVFRIHRATMDVFTVHDFCLGG